MKLYFNKTCNACPEQYDVYDETGSQIGYVRLRWGNLSVRTPDYSGNVIYEHSFSNGLQGCFDNSAQRDAFLQKVSGRLLNRLHDNGQWLDFSEDELEYEVVENM